jgi:hypothetical protein
MSDRQRDPDAREEQFNELLAEYLMALDAGRAPDRGSWIAEHAEFAEQLEEFFTGSEQFRRVSESFHASVARTSEQVGAENSRRPGTDPTQPWQSTPKEDKPVSLWPASGRPPALERFPPGTVLLGRYHVVDQLGKGGMGEVYRAFDLVLGQHVALKFLPSQIGLDPETLERFRNEVRLARQINHENVCGVYDIGDLDGEPFISMEYIDGEDLSALLHRVGRLPVEMALSVAEHLCAGLSAAHERGVLHRDLKPSNVMLDSEGRVRITDFGLAILETEADHPDEVAGTPAYMAPEQWSGGELSARTDLYALGLILYQMFTGKKGHSKRARLGEPAPPDPPSAHLPGIHPMIEAAILKCLDCEPENRPPSASAVMQELPPKSDPVWREPLPPGEERPGQRAARRWKLVAVAAIGVVLVSLAGNLHLFRNRLRGPLPPEIQQVWHAPGQDCPELEGSWKAVWYELRADEEYHPYGKEQEYEEPVEIDVDGAVFFSDVVNPLRGTPYFWYGRGNPAGRYCAVYFSPPESSEHRSLSGVMYLAADYCKREGEKGPMYLLGDWHGYCLNLDPQSSDQGKLQDFRGKVIVYSERDRDEVFAEHPELRKP